MLKNATTYKVEFEAIQRFHIIFISLNQIIRYSDKVLFNKLIRLSLLSLPMQLLLSLVWITQESFVQCSANLDKFQKQNQLLDVVM